MALAIFPAYGIARLRRPSGLGLFAAAVATIAPALAYAPILVEEPFAYPVATLALYLVPVGGAARGLLLAAAGCGLRGRDAIPARRPRSRARPLALAVSGAATGCRLARTWTRVTGSGP